MALQDSGSGGIPALSMSVADINVELANNSNDPIDFVGAAASFSGILPGTVELLEFYNKTFAGGAGDYGSLESHALRFLVFSEQGESDVNTGWISENGELVLCAENADLPDDSRGANTSTALASDTEFIDDFISGDLTVGDVVYKNSAGSSLTDLRPGGDFPGSNTHFMLDTTSDKIFDVNSSAVIQNVVSRTPDTPDAPTLSSRTGNSITVDVAADTIVTRQLVPVLGGVDQTAILPSASGSIGNTDVTTQHTFTGLNSGQTYVLGFKAKNNFATTAQGATLSQATTAATTWTNNTSSIALQIDTAKSGQQDTFVRPSTSQPAANIDVNNHNGNTSVSVTQANYFPGSGQLQIAVSVQGDPGSAGNDNSGTGWATSHTGIEHDLGTKIYYRIRHQDIANNTETDPVNQTETITFTNNSVNATVSVPYRIQQV